MPRFRSFPYTLSLTLLSLILMIGTGRSLEFKPYGRGDFDQIAHLREQRARIIHYWSVTCPACIAELGQWAKFINDHRDMDIIFINTALKDVGTKSEMKLMGMNGWNIITKRGGWSYYPWSGQTKSDAMTEDDHKLAIEDLDMLEDFLTYKEKGKSIDYYGMEDVDGTECFKIKMIDKYVKESTYFIDPDTYMTIKITNKVKTNGQENEFSTFFSNYEKLPEGIVMPMSSTNGWSENRITKIEVNVLVDEKIFVPSK